MDSIKSKYVYEVYTSSIFFDVDQMTITHLYQPIIGTNAIALYLVLLTEANNIRYTLIRPSHDRLLNILHLSLNQFMDAKNKLEAIGLLKTYANPSEVTGDSNYIYILYPPKTPKTFLNTTYLANKLKLILGELDFDRTVYFLTQKFPNITKFVDVSKKFDEIFTKEDSKVSDIKLNDDILNRDKQIIEYDIIKQLSDMLQKNSIKFDISTNRKKEMILKVIEDTNVSINNLYLAIEALVKNGDSVSYKQILKSLEMNLLLNNFMKKEDIEESLEEEYISKKSLGNKNSKTTKISKIKNVIDWEDDEDLIDLDNEYDNLDYEYICNPSSIEFFEQLTGKLPSLTDKNHLKRLAINMDVTVINLLIYYIYKKQNLINWNYINKVATTIQEKKWSHDFDAAKNFLDGVYHNTKNKL